MFLYQTQHHHQRLSQTYTARNCIPGIGSAARPMIWSRQHQNVRGQLRSAAQVERKVNAVTQADALAVAMSAVARTRACHEN